MSNEAPNQKQPTGRVASDHERIVMSLQPCPHCGSRPIDAYKKEDEIGMGYYLVFDENGCMACYGKTGILRVFPLSHREVEVAKKFRLET